MIMNDDYFNLCLEKVKSINYINDYIDLENMKLLNHEFCSLFIIDEENYNNSLMNSMDIAFIQSIINLKEIELNYENRIKLLELSTTKRVTSKLNRLLVEKCLTYYNKNNENKLDIDNINKVLDSIK